MVNREVEDGDITISVEEESGQAQIGVIGSGNFAARRKVMLYKL